MPERNESQNNGRARRKGPAERRAPALSVLRRFFQIVGTLLLVIVLTGSLVCCYGAVYIKNVVIPNAEIDMSAYSMDENSIIYYYDKSGEPVQLAELSGKENRQQVTYDEIPEDLINAIVAIEDKRFWEHKGVDWYRTGGAVVNMFLSMRNTFGGSTITQQLVKNVTGYDDGTVKRKVMEIFTALDLEKKYSKEQILAWYLNEIYLGSGCYGVQAAAQKYFGKSVSELTLAECASLAGITNNPSLYGPYAVVETIRYRCQNKDCKWYSLDPKKPCDGCGGTEYGEAEVWDARRWNKARQETILKSMADPKVSPDGAYITQEEYEAAVAQELVFARDMDIDTDAEDAENEAKAQSTIHSWYVDAVISEVISDLVETKGWSQSHAVKAVYSGGLRIYVPYDPEVQAAVDEVYTDRANLNYVSKSGQKMSSAITVIDNATGHVVALAGDMGEKTVNRGWNNALANQQPGSSIKPLAVYSPALEAGLITPATVLDDNPQLLNDKPWPVNAPAVYNGLTTVQDGVVRSVNTISLNVLDMVTPQMAYEFLTQRYGITSLVYPSDEDRAPLSMGGLTRGMSTFEMAAAYATFPRNGGYTKATTYLLVEEADGNILIDNQPKTEYVIKESTAYYINTMLTAAVNSGTGYKARIAGQTVAGKTGTTNDIYDLWFAGYTPYYTAAVWTGYPYDEYMGNIANPSVTLWRKVMEKLHQGREGIGFYEPENLRTVSICRDCGKLSTADCENDVRGNRAQVFKLMKEDCPKDYCTCHVPVVICTESPILNENGEATGAYHLAGEFCPEECQKEVFMVEYNRTLVDESVMVVDIYGHIALYDTMEDPYCPIHKAPELPPEEPDGPTQPEDPDTPAEPWEPDTPTQPEEPGEPEQPVEPSESIPDEMGWNDWPFEW